MDPQAQLELVRGIVAAASVLATGVSLALAFYVIAKYF